MSYTAPTCANCGTEATIQCEPCMDAPEYEPGDSTSTFYCTPACQTADLRNHKTYCRIRAQRKRLLRAAIIIKAALLVYSEPSYERTIAELDRLDKVLALPYNCGGSYYPRLDPDAFLPDPTPAQREAVLMYSLCGGLATRLVGRLTHKLLAGLPCVVQQIQVHVETPSVKTRLLRNPQSLRREDTILKVDLLFGGGTWIIDPAAAQFGVSDVLFPYDRCISDRGIDLVGEPATFNVTETSDIDYLLNEHTPPLEGDIRDAIALERPSRVRLASFVNTCVRNDILIGSAGEFDAKVEAFKEALGLHMAGSE